MLKQGGAASKTIANEQMTERNNDFVIYVGNIDERVGEPLLWELFNQVAPVVHVHMPRDRVTQSIQGFGFVDFLSADDAVYAVKVGAMLSVSRSDTFTHRKRARSPRANTIPTSPMSHI